MSRDGRHEVEDGISRRDPLHGSLRERRISSALEERTGLEELGGGDLTRGGFSFALSGLLGFGRSALGGGLRGGFYLGR